jgi:hypothetical protein
MCHAFAERIGVCQRQQFTLGHDLYQLHSETTNAVIVKGDKQFRSTQWSGVSRCSDGVRASVRRCGGAGTARAA